MGKAAGSVGFWNAARSVVLVTKEDDEHRLVSQVKANWARAAGVHRYQLRQVILAEEIDPQSGYPITSALAYLGEAEDVDADTVLRSTSSDDAAGTRHGLYFK